MRHASWIMNVRQKMHKSEILSKDEIKKMQLIIYIENKKEYYMMSFIHSGSTPFKLWWVLLALFSCFITLSASSGVILRFGDWGKLPKAPRWSMQFQQSAILHNLHFALKTAMVVVEGCRASPESEVFAGVRPYSAGRGTHMEQRHCRALLKLWAEDEAAWRKGASKQIEAHYRRRMGLGFAPQEHPMGHEQQLTSVWIGRLSFFSPVFLCI